MFLLTIPLAIIAIGVPLVLLYLGLKMTITIFRWLGLLTKNGISPTGRGLHVVQLYGLRNFDPLNHSQSFHHHI